MQAFTDWVKEQPGSVLGILFLLIGLHFFFSLVKRGLRMGKGQTVHIHAKVIEKNEYDQNGALLLQVSFETGGVVMRLKVDAESYHKLSPGQRGKLVYRGKEFINFK